MRCTCVRSNNQSESRKVICVSTPVCTLSGLPAIRKLFSNALAKTNLNLLTSLKPLDIEIMKRLGTRCNLIPVIAKADTLTQADLRTFKQRVRAVIQAQGIRVYQPPIEPDDEAAAEHARLLSDSMPFSIIGSTEDVKTADGRVVKGREYLWGVAEGKLFALSGYIEIAHPGG